MKRTKLISLVAICILCSPYSAMATQKQMVEDVELRGYRTVTRQALLDVIKTRPGHVYDAKQVKRDFAQVMAMRHFDKILSRVVIEDGPRGGKLVIFDLKELPRNR